MTGYILEWLNFLGRWFHMIVGIAWIGASFYFIWLDSHLRTPRYPEEADRLGLSGEVWALHGGGFYRAQKFKIAPPEMPDPLHWFKWEAYTTWLSGMFLMVLIYYVQADVYLIDQRVANLTHMGAVLLGLVFLALGWIIYDVLCRTALSKNEPVFAAILFVLSGLAAYLLCSFFSGRGAFIHFGAMLGTIMAANVFFVIMPGQREMVKAKAENRVPDPKHAANGKLRSVHNTYFTMPVLFVMISNHYALFTNHKYNWAVLMAIALAGVLIRLYFTFKHRGNHRPWLFGGGLLILAGVFWALRPAPVIAPPAGAASTVSYARVAAIIEQRCAVCHAEKPSFAGFAAAPKNILLDSKTHIATNAQSTYQQAVVLKAMPPGNLTGITDAERGVIEAWFVAGAKVE